MQKINICRFVFLLCFCSLVISASEDKCREMKFAKPIEGQALTHHVIRTIDVTTEDFCGAKCFMENDCVSYNFKATSSGAHKCDLNNSTHVEHPDDLEILPDYLYRTTKNACGPMPCQNNATCHSGYTDKGYRCLCVAGFTGEHCEVEIDECASIPCQNEGTCRDLLNNFTCTCQPGFTGNRCETDVDECASNPCHNEGTCTDDVSGYTCSCLPGFTGSQCEVDIDECSSSPCENGGACSDLPNAYNCTCQPGFDGIQCQTDIDECAVSPCLNGGVCDNLVNLFRCICPPDFGGDICEMFPAECQGSTGLSDGTRLFTGAGGSGCDKKLNGWFHFSGAAGTKMYEGCTSKYDACGASFPGYLRGSHPTVGEGLVSRQACFYDGECNRKCNNITVRKCVDFFVYNLKPFDQSWCNSRYCGSV